MDDLDREAERAIQNYSDALCMLYMNYMLHTLDGSIGHFKKTVLNITDQLIEEIHRQYAGRVEEARKKRPT